MGKEYKGLITKIGNNYGEITYKLKKIKYTIPFLITKEMIVKVNEREYICYSKNVSFQLERQDDFRNRSITIAKNVKFQNDEFLPTIYQERIIDTDDFWKKIKIKFDNYFVKIPTKNEQIEYLEKHPDDEVRNQIYFQKLMSSLADQNMYSDSYVLLREYLKFNGFQTRMEEYLIDQIFVNKETVYKQIIDKTDINLTIEMIVDLDRIDITFKEKILGWVLGIEDSYKSWISRKLKDPIQTKKQSGEKLFNYWKNKNGSGSRQVNRAIQKGLSRDSKDGFDYMNKTAPIDDLLEELDFSELLELLSAFKKFDEATIDSFDELIKSKSLLNSVRQIRNLAAHGKTLIPNLMDPYYNANFLLDIAKQSNNIRKWPLYNGFKNHFTNNNFSEASSKNRVKEIYGNPYRQAWVNLNYIYHRFVRKIDPERFHVYNEDFEDFFSNRSSEKSFYRLDKISNIQQTNQLNSPYRLIYNEACISKYLGDIDFSIWPY